MAPSTPPPPRSASFAALTIASTAKRRDVALDDLDHASPGCRFGRGAAYGHVVTTSPSKPMAHPSNSAHASYPSRFLQ